MGWRFRRSTWGHVYATEAAQALIAQLFAGGAQRVFAQTMAVNARSRAVMERLSLRHVATFHLYIDNPLPGTVPAAARPLSDLNPTTGRARVEASVPMGRLGSVDELAHMALPFIDGPSRFTTTQFVAFAGGCA